MRSRFLVLKTRWIGSRARDWAMVWVALSGLWLVVCRKPRGVAPGWGWVAPLALTSPRRRGIPMSESWGVVPARDWAAPLALISSPQRGIPVLESRGVAPA